MPARKKVASKKKSKIDNKKSAIESEEREVVHSKLKSQLCMGLNRKQAQDLLGWHAESENVKFKTDYLLKDTNGIKIRCHHNVNNRPLYMSNVDSLKQEILRRKWMFNGEPIIIGKYGAVLNGQHQLIALELACQEWDKHPGKWIGWQDEPTIDKLVVYGVDESNDTVNTMDTCKPRTLADVIYRNDCFADVKTISERKLVARICSYAINTLWSRMGAEHAFAPRQTHSEALDFISKHPKVLEAVYHIYVEDGDSNISKYLSPGYAAGMLYLMGCSTTEPSKYISNPTESSLDWTNWDKACEFFVFIASGADEVKSLKLALLKLMNEEEGITRIERLALVAEAWLQFVSKGKVDRLQLKYVDTDEGRKLEEIPSVGGIDLIEFS